LKKRSQIALILLFSFVLLAWWAAGQPLQKYLSLNKPLHSTDLLVAEGWLDSHELDYIANYFRDGDSKYLVTTGYSRDQNLLMYKNGRFFRRVNERAPDNQTVNLQVRLQGTLTDQYASLFRLYINDTFIALDSVGRKAKTFRYSIRQTDSINSVSLEFINDAIIEGKDRNLLVHDLILNGRSFPVLDTMAMYSIHTADDSSVFKLAGTQAELARNLLIGKGIPGNRVIAISSDRPGISKTLTSAKNTIHALDSMFRDTGYSVNIISIPPHTRRTYAAFCKFHPKDSTGILAIPVSFSKNYGVNRLKNLRELLGLMFIKFQQGS
jgi:hypothetical protein